MATRRLPRASRCRLVTSDSADCASRSEVGRSKNNTSFPAITSVAKSTTRRCHTDRSPTLFSATSSNPGLIRCALIEGVWVDRVWVDCVSGLIMCICVCGGGLIGCVCDDRGCRYV